MGLKSYRELDAWKRGMELAVAAYEVSRSLPNWERFELSSQIRRAAVSVPANIAEGYGLHGRGAYVQRLGSARGSLNELDTELQLTVDVGYCTPGMIARAQSLIDREGQLVQRLIRSLGYDE